MTEHEQLLKLRALVAKMDAQLAEKDQIIDKQTEQIEKQNERIEKLNIRIENMIQSLLHARKKLFGPSTECIKQVEGQRARLNDLDVFAYLKYLLTEKPNNHHPVHPEIIDNYLPWSATLPQECRLNYKNKKYY